MPQQLHRGVCEFPAACCDETGEKDLRASTILFAPHMPNESINIRGCAPGTVYDCVFCLRSDEQANQLCRRQCIMRGKGSSEHCMRVYVSCAQRGRGRKASVCPLRRLRNIQQYVPGIWYISYKCTVASFSFKNRPAESRRKS